MATKYTGNQGPLGKLYSKNIFSFLSYPRDVQDKPHSIKFSILLPSNSSYQSVAASTSLETGFDFLDGQRKTNITDGGRAFGIATIKNTKSVLQAAITLYMPDTVNMTYGASYQEDNLSDYKLPFYGQLGLSAKDQIMNPTQDFLSNLGSAAPESLAGFQRANPGLPLVGSFNENVPVDILLREKGLAINPQVQVLFKAVALRTFQFEFLFTPYSQEEAANVQEIIKAFKFHAAPEIGRPAGATNNPKNAVFFVVPSTFKIEYQFNGKINENINKIGECVLESVTVDYATNGWVTFEDGSPVQTRMTLQFKEIEIVDKAKVDQGF